MSPRSEELMAQARDRLTMAREALEAGHLAGAVSVAYYAMLYAARAALSESDASARTHRGTWHLFHQRYVASDAFADELYARAASAQRTREQGDYEAFVPDRGRAEAVVADAGGFIAAVERMLDG